MDKVLAVISDLHVPDMYNELPRGLIKELVGADTIICAGDITRLEVLKELEEVAPVEAVHGNRCSVQLQEKLPEFKKLDFSGLTIGVTHGTGPFFNQKKRMLKRARREGCAIIVYGHSHRPSHQEMGEVVLLNPGSPTCPLKEAPRSMARIHLGKRSFKTEIINLE